MDEYKKENWVESGQALRGGWRGRFEINFSCPHGMPERKMGAAMGQDCTVLDEVCGWVKEVATVPVWAKMTPNITDITVPAKVCSSRVWMELPPSTPSCPSWGQPRHPRPGAVRRGSQHPGWVLVQGRPSHRSPSA